MAKIRKPPKPTVPGGVRGKPIVYSNNKSMGIKLKVNPEKTIRILKPEHVKNEYNPSKIKVRKVRVK